MINIRHLTKRFGDRAVLNNISLEVAKGEVVAIIGPSGSGKSTLLRCMNLLESPEAGTIVIGERTLDCRRYTRKEAHALRQQTAMVFQNYNLFKNKTALENVTEALIVVKKMPKAQAREKGMALLARVGLEPQAGQYPVTLSGGQQQRSASPGRWRWSRRRCCSMSRRRRWTQSGCMKCCRSSSNWQKTTPRW